MVNNHKTHADLIAENEQLHQQLAQYKASQTAEYRSLKESEEKFRKLFHNANDAIFLWEIKNGMPAELIEANEAAARRLGYTIREITKLQLTDFSMDSPEKSAAIMSRLLKDKHGSFESSHKTRDGHIFPVEINSHVFTLGKKQVILSVVRDISARKKAESELTELYNREKELRRALENEISKRIDFTRSLVHELKTPLTPMIASGEVLLELLDNEDELRLAGNIYRGALNLERRINDLLDFARGEMGVLKVSIQPLDISPLLLDLAAEVSPQFDRKQQSLELEIADNLPFVMADEDRLRQVLLNLLNNSAKFTPRGGQITLGAKVSGKMLQLSVADTGRGIDLPEQSNIFQPYYRVESDNDSNDGMGIGLTLCKMLISLHGGEIWFTSKKGHGSTFYFTIPLSNNQ